MIQIEKIAENLFDKIRSRFDGVSIGDENAKTTLDPENARFFNFDFVTNGENFGNITISIVDSNNLKVYFDKEIEKDMTDDQKEVWYDFLRGLRLFAKRNMITFDIRDIAKSGLNLKDLKHANKDAEVFTSSEIKVTESKLYGTSRSTYENYSGKVRIIARHKKPIVDETKPGARSRNVESFYIENSLGERFKCPEGTTFSGARAYARHVKNGGSMHDDFGQHIGKIIKEMSTLKTFVRNVRGRTFEDLETSAMVEAAIDHYGKLHRDLHTLRGQRGYEAYQSLWQPEVIDEDDIDLDSLKEKFVRRVFDDRLTDALPIVHKAYKNRCEEVGEEFESWANTVLEDDEENPINDQNKDHVALKQDIEENDEDDVNTKSPFANSMGPVDSDGNHFEDDEENQKISELLNQNGFEFRYSDGVYYFESKEELERAKDIIAQQAVNNNETPEYPRMGIYDYGYGTYGSTTFDRDLSRASAGVMEDVNLIKILAGLSK